MYDWITLLYTWNTTSWINYTFIIFLKSWHTEQTYGYQRRKWGWNGLGNWDWHVYTAAAAAKSLQSCPTLCDPIDGSPLGSPVPGILQVRTLEQVAISFPNAWKWKVKSESEVAQSCPTLSDPMDCSLPGSSIHGIFQARVLEWGAIFSFNLKIMSFTEECLDNKQYRKRNVSPFIEKIK